MKDKLTDDEIRKAVSLTISEFNDNNNETIKNNQECLDELKKILKPSDLTYYQFLTNNNTDLIESILNNRMSISNKTIFGESFYEKLVCNILKVRDCKYELISKFDNDFDKVDISVIINEIKYLLQIKSAPNWGNSSSIEQTETVLKSHIPKGYICIICCINGHDDNNKRLGNFNDYFLLSNKEVNWLCGNVLFEFLTGNSRAFRIILNCAKENTISIPNKNVEQLTECFLKNFVDNDGNIKWDLIYGGYGSLYEL